MANELDNNGKFLYCTPYKALDWQKYYDFSRWFCDGLKTKVVITDGDNPVRTTDLLDARIVIATYERVLGAIQSAEQWIRDITLVCADEITLFDDKPRRDDRPCLNAFQIKGEAAPDNHPFLPCWQSSADF